MDQAKRFYGGLMGWSFEDTTRPNGGDYTLITSGDRLVGGIVQLDDPVAANFYASLAGFQVVDQQRELGVYHVLMSQGQRRAGLMQRPADDIDPFWLTQFGVKDVTEAAQRVSELGGQIFLGPDPDFRNGLQAIVIDPAGTILALHQWAEWLPG